MDITIITKWLNFRLTQIESINFAGNKKMWMQNFNLFFGRVEKSMGKGENAG